MSFYLHVVRNPVEEDLSEACQCSNSSVGENFINDLRKFQCVRDDFPTKPR